MFGPVHARGDQGDRRAIDGVDLPLELPQKLLSRSPAYEARREVTQVLELFPEQGLRHRRVAHLVGMGEVVPRWRRGGAYRRERTGVELQTVADIIEAQGMRQLRIAQADRMTPGAECPRFLVHAGLVGDLRHQVGRNVVADLTQNGEFARGWGLVFFHDLPCGRFSSSFQPFFSPIPVGWL